MEREMQPKIEHFSHGHELQPSEEDLQYDCNMCKQTISGLHYRCTMVGCEFNIHKSCSEIPRHMQHPFHPQHDLSISDEVCAADNNEYFCNACGCNCADGFAYSCSQCSFFLDVKCALLTIGKNELGQLYQNIQLDDHPHRLMVCDAAKNHSYTCSCCDLPLEGGLFYVCLDCKALLHKSCGKLPLNIEHHPFHPSRPLILFPHDSKGFRCTVCSQKRNSFTYRCSNCDFVLDFHCASLKPAENNEGKDRQKSKFPHRLICYNTEPKFPHPCHACGLTLVGSIYYCPEFYALLHQSCADLPQKINHLLHPQHPLTICYIRYGERNRQCQACFDFPSGFFFECSECEWYIEARCALPKPTTTMPKIHHHHLVFFNEANHLLECEICGQPCHTPFFRCLACDLNLHVHCVSTLPPKIKYKRHVHPLTLSDSPIKDYPDDDDDAAFYCHACEELRELDKRSYYCEECPYVAHPHCVAFEIIRVVNGERSKQESHDSADEVKEPALTLNEFFDSFIKHDYNELDGVMEAYKAYSRGVSVDNPKLSLYLDEASMQMMKMLVSEKQVELPWKNWDETSEVIKVGEYMIHEEWSHILIALFDKYGDFSCWSTLGPKVKMFYVMVVCDAVHSMCNTKVIDVTTSQLLNWYRCFMLGQCAGFEIKFVLDRLTKVVHAHFAQLNEEIAKQRRVVDSKELVAIKFDGEAAGYCNNKDVESMQLALIKLDQEIEMLEKTLESKRALRRSIKEWSSDAAELEGQMAGTGLL